MRRCLLVSVVLLAGCQTYGFQPATPVAAPEAPTTLPRAVHWMRNSAEYEALLHQTYALAARQLRQVAADREPGTWAVAVDADETVISNTEYDKELVRQGKSSTPEQWDAWVARRAAPPLPGAIEFLESVRELGGRIAIVTNRLEEHCADTQANFRAFSIPFDVMLCRTEDREKEPRWQRIKDGSAAPSLPPLEIVMWLGDNIKDFPSLDQSTRSAPGDVYADFGTRFFLVPNPMYGSWIENPED